MGYFKERTSKINQQRIIKNEKVKSIFKKMFYS